MRTPVKILMFFVLTLIVSVSGAEAKVCFLPGILNGDGCLDNSSWMVGCEGYTRTTPCEEGYQEQTCTYKGKTYYRCTCASDRVLNMEGGKYVCNGVLDPECGCAGSETICNTSRFPYEGCADYVGATGSGGSCRSPADGVIWYEKCSCSKTVYPYDCKETGLKEPSGVEYCEDSDGEKWYPFCICDDNWTTVECSSRTDGCTTLLEEVYNGVDNCYHCGAETCSEKDDVNLAAYWCDVTKAIITDCEQLGYVKAGNCQGKNTGLKCPFDSSYIYCQSAN